MPAVPARRPPAPDRAARAGTRWLAALLLAASPVASIGSDGVPLSQMLRRVWTTDSGMPQISAVDLAQDRQGYLWIATEGGLTRFDGSLFRHYTSAGTPGFTHDMVRRLHIDSAGRLWVATAGQLLRRDGESFVRILRHGEDSGGHYAFAEDANGTLWTGGDALYRIEGNALTAVPDHQGPVHALFADGDRLLVGGVDGIGERQPDRARWLPLHGAGSGVRVTGFARHHGALWAATTQGLFRRGDDGWARALAARIGEQPVHLVHTDREGDLWVSTDAGLLRLRAGAEVEAVGRDDAGGFPWTVSALNDRDGHLWLGSQSHGLLRLRVDRSRRLSTAEGLHDPFVWSLIPWGEDLLVGGNDGVARLSGGRFSRVIDGTRLPNPVAMSMLRDAEGRLWVGTRAGLARFDPPDWLDVTRFPELQHVQVNGIVQDPEGALWVASSGGVFRLYDDGWRIPEPLLPLAGQRVRYLREDGRNGLWIASERGLYRFDGANLERSDHPLLRDSFVTLLHRLRDGRLLVGTFNQGLLVEDGQGGWRQPGPLPSTGAMFVAEVGSDLLVSSLQGVYRLGMASLERDAVVDTSVLLDDSGSEPRGDQWRCCNGAGHDKGLHHGGSVWLPTLDGVVRFPADSVRLRESGPSAVIDGLEHSGIFTAPPAAALASGDRDWRFAFSAPMFSRANAVQFRYRLDGYDQAWVEAGARREAFYTNLPPGEYAFEVQAGLRGDSSWGPPTEMQVRLLPRWHESTLARTAFVALLALLLWGLHRGRVAALRLRQAQLERMVTERTRELEDSRRALERAAITDPLTGLHNRRYLDLTADLVLARSRRAGVPTAWMLVDVDHFKRINDMHGHAVGDAVLRRLAALLRAALREGDHLLRWGGEEFLIVLESAEEAAATTTRLRAGLRAVDWNAEFRLARPLQISIGIAWHPSPLAQLADWGWEPDVALADRALYEVKQAGRNGWMELRVSANAPANLAELLADLPTAELLAKGWLQARGPVRGPDAG